LAKASDQFRSRDVTFWGVFALAVWAVAVLGANLSALIPDGVLGGLHASRLDGATLNQLRAEMVSLRSETTRLKQENSVLAQQHVLTEVSGTDLARRLGALEQTVPNILESLNNPPGVDRTLVTASTGATTKSFPVEGGRPPPPPPRAPAPPPGAAAGGRPLPKPVPPVAAPAPASFGAALGPPIDSDEAEATWQGMTGRVGTLLIGLGPLLGHVEGGSGRRLVAGPISSEADARDLCGRVAKAGIACQSVPFIGDPLPLLN